MALPFEIGFDCKKFVCDKHSSLLLLNKKMQSVFFNIDSLNFNKLNFNSII